jgi:hypothetical protein
MTVQDTSVTLGSFEHRRDYGAVTGRDRWTVQAVNAWVRETLPTYVAALADGAALDVGCGEQPFRTLIESYGRRYVGMDVVQNSSRTVDILSTLEDAPSPAARFPLILCTEVLEHVGDIDAAFAGLRRLAAPGGAVVVTVPFVFPLHMQPFDYRRLTPYGLERLATTHGFQVESSAQLGRLTDVLATLISDCSILPLSRSLLVKAKVALLRGGAAALVRILDSRALSSAVAINANVFLSNGVVLRAQ